MFDLKNKQKSYGKNTIDALNAGFIWGYDGLINNIINKITKNWKMNYKIILTGGYANLFKNTLKICPTISLFGLFRKTLQKPVVWKL